LPRRLAQGIGAAQRDQRAFGATRHGAAHMGLRRRAVAGGQDELLQLRQLRVVLGQRVVQRSHGFGLQQFVTRDRELAAQVEQLMLDLHQKFPHVRGHLLAQQQADVRIEFVHLAHGVYAQMVLGHTGVVAQARGAVVAGARGDLREALAHAVLLTSCIIVRYLRPRDVSVATLGKSAGRSRRLAMQCALPQLLKEMALTRSRRRRITLPEFETCSLALFAALAMSAPSATRAQATFGPARVAASTPATTASVSTLPRSTKTLVLSPGAKPAPSATPAEKTKR
jgi:hypothetical protein